jgi:hypothetical protein
VVLEGGTEFEVAMELEVFVRGVDPRIENGPDDTFSHRTELSPGNVGAYRVDGSVHPTSIDAVRTVAESTFNRRNFQGS